VDGARNGRFAEDNRPAMRALSIVLWVATGIGAVLTLLAFTTLTQPDERMTALGWAMPAITVALAVAAFSSRRLARRAKAGERS
jgi:hypothetical protein